ncbi:MAG: DUF86 domain-containing protein [Candidatus Asgardarchaeia archaeon]
MNKQRSERYREKLNLIEMRISQIINWTSNLDEDDFQKNDLVKLAVYKAFQEIVESSMDIISMICKDIGIPPKDDYTNIETLLKQGILDTALANIMFSGNGLRNRIVHRYNTLDDRRAFIEIIEAIPEFERFVEVIEEWIKKHLLK